MSKRIKLIKSGATAGSLAAALLTTFAAREACAQTGTTVDYGTAGSDYTQNFDGLSTTSSPALPTAPGIFAFGDSQTPVTGAVGAGATGMAGWYGQAALKNVYLAGDGSTTTGGFYNFATAGAQPVTDQALGLITTSASGQEIFGLELTNTTGSTLTSFTIDFNAETWHTGNTGTSNTLSFGYNLGGATLPAIDGTGTITPASGSYVAVPSLNYTVAGSGTTGALDGHATGNNTDETTTINGLSWTAGETLWLTWDFAAANAKSPGLAIDNLTFSAVGGGVAAANPVWHVSDGTGIWDKVTSNWIGGVPTAGLYKDGDNATFDDTHSGTAGGTVTIQAGGVSPGSTTVNTTGTYTFQNTGTDANGISGNGGLTKNGTGTLVLSSQNTYLGGTTVNGGTLRISNDNQLGGPNGALVMDNSTLQLTGAINSARAFTAGVDGVTLTTNGNSFTTSGSTAINGTFTPTGSGVIALNGLVSFGATGALNIPTGATVTLGQAAGTINLNDGATINGTLNIAGIPRVNFNGTAANVGGTGNINVQTTGLLITNLSSTAGSTVTTNLVLNSTDPAGLSFSKGDVTQATYVPGSFVTTIGGTTANFGLTINSVISGFSDVNIANATAGGGSGTLILGGQSTYRGATTFNANNGGAQLAVNNAFPTTTDFIFGTQVAANGNALLDLGGYNQQFASLSSGTGAGALATFTITNSGATPSTLTVSGSTTPANAFSGAIDDNSAIGGQAVSLVKGGTSTLTLNGTNTYSGTTQITGGTLALGPLGSIASTAAISISGGAHLDVSQVSGGLFLGGASAQILNGGSGTTAATIIGTVTVNSGSTISPHLTAGTTGELALTGGNFTLSSGAHLTLDLKGKVAGASYDQLQVSGNITLGGDLAGSTLSYIPTIGDVLDIIINNGGTTTGTLDGVAQDGIVDIGGDPFKISYDATTSAFDSTGHDVALMALVPEPGSAALLLTGLTVFATARRRGGRGALGVS